MLKGSVSSGLFSWSFDFVFQLVSGSAEIFGIDLIPAKRYLFISGAKVAVFTWEGCRVTLIGKTEVCYTAKETPMTMYLNVHVALEQMRVKADTENNCGPRVTFHAMHFGR